MQMNMNTEQPEMSPTDRTEMNSSNLINQVRCDVGNQLDRIAGCIAAEKVVRENLERKNKQVMDLCQKRDMQYLEFQSTLTHIRDAIYIKRAEYHAYPIVLLVLTYIEEALDGPKQNQVNQITPDNQGAPEECCGAQQPKKSEKTLLDEINELKGKIEVLEIVQKKLLEKENLFHVITHRIS